MADSAKINQISLQHPHLDYVAPKTYAYNPELPLKILHVYDHSLPLHSGYVFRSLAILREQRKLGWDTVHITTPRHTVGESAVEEIEGYKFYRTLGADGLLHRIPVAKDLYEMSLTQRVIDDVIRAEKPDIVQANSPVLNAIPALRAAARHNLPVVYEIRAFWEDAAVTAGSTSEGSLRYKLTRAMESYAVKHADAVTTICNGLRKDIVDRGVPESKVTLIPNAVDIENFQADIPRDEALAQSLDLNGKFPRLLLCL